MGALGARRVRRTFHLLLLGTPRVPALSPVSPRPEPPGPFSGRDASGGTAGKEGSTPTTGRTVDGGDRPDARPDLGRRDGEGSRSDRGVARGLGTGVPCFRLNARPSQGHCLLGGSVTSGAGREDPPMRGFRPRPPPGPWSPRGSTGSLTEVAFGKTQNTVPTNNHSVPGTTVAEGGWGFG